MCCVCASTSVLPHPKRSLVSKHLTRDPRYVRTPVEVFPQFSVFLFPPLMVKIIVEVLTFKDISPCRLE